MTPPSDDLSAPSLRARDAGDSLLPDARDLAAHQGAASLWPDLTRPAELEPASVGTSETRAGLPGSTLTSAFDLCHVGVVLRTVLLVQAVVLLAVPFVTASAPAAASSAGDLGLALLARGSLVALWGTLLWLIAGCAVKRWLAVRSLPVQATAAVGLGVAASGAGLWLLGFSGLEPVVAPVPWWAPLAAGGAIAGAVFHGLRLRLLARTPADATARLAELQSRIRPHFLFNTLNTAVTLVRVDPGRAETVLEDLAALFRVALEDVGESVSLAEEVELARRYLEIEQLRFGDRLRVSWELDPEGDVARVPPLLLQPLVENAVRHGIEPLREGGLLRVRTQVRRGYVVIDIRNPVGRRGTPGRGIALNNVRERLRLMHDVAAQFEARRDGDVFRVRIVLPV